MLPEWTIVGFTGHRHLKHPGKVAEGIHNALERLSGRYGSLAAVSSAASGSDTLFLEEVVRRKLPLLVLLPFPKSRFEKDFKPPEWHRVAPLLNHALRVEEGRGAESDDAAYMQTGEHTVDRADVIIAVWDGKPAEGLGGTGDVVAYAEALQKPLIFIHPETGAITEKNLPPPHAKPHPAGPAGDLRELVEKHFRELDEIAVAQAPRARILILRIISLHLLAAAAGVTALIFQSSAGVEITANIVEVAVLARAFYLILQHRKKHGAWMRTRVEAEICRSFLATWHIPLNVGNPQKIALAGFDRVFRGLRLLRHLDRPAGRPEFDEARRQYLKDRIEDQIAHFSRRQAQSETWLRRLKAATRVSTAVALASTLLLLFSPWSARFVSGAVMSAALWFSMVLPVFSAGLASVIVSHEYGRRAARYREMVSLLEDAKKRLCAVRTWDGLSRIAAETEGELLQEVVEWHSYTRFAGEPH